jgi:hypothetical protein
MEYVPGLMSRPCAPMLYYEREEMTMAELPTPTPTSRHKVNRPLAPPAPAGPPPMRTGTGLPKWVIACLAVVGVLMVIGLISNAVKDDKSGGSTGAGRRRAQPG